MAFNGSKARAEGEMVKILERHGLAFGADTNASTDFDETVYKLDLPKTDDDTVDTSLMLLREVASELTLAQAAVDRERGVVLSEERAATRPAYRVVQGQPAASSCPASVPTRRLPIGQVEVLKNATRRPDRRLLQPLLPARARRAGGGRRLRSRRHGGQDQGPVRRLEGRRPGRRRARPRQGAETRKTEAKLVVEPGAPLIVADESGSARPTCAPTAKAKRRGDLIEQPGFAVLNRRLDRAGSRADDPPFLGAGAFKADQFHSAEVTIAADSSPSPTTGARRWPRRDQEERRAVRYGVRQDELDREIDRGARLAEGRRRRRRHPPPRPPIADEIVETARRRRGRDQPRRGPGAVRGRP